MSQTMNSRDAERKPLSFSTTMRNPSRIVAFLNCIVKYEGQILTNEIINEIAEDLIINKLYYTQQYEMKNPTYKAIYYSEDLQFTKEQAKDIIKNSPQNHKEKGFDKGWPSRFDTWYKLPKEFGFLFYELGKPIEISQTGHMLIDAYNEEPINNLKVQNVMLNALMKYQSDNPFRKNLNSNVPLLLLLNVLKLLKEDKEENGAGLYIKELSLLICWQNGDYNELYNVIKQIRKENKFNYSDEYMYEKCLAYLDADETKHKRFKMNQICGESIDEYIRKMRSTGVISLRGNGRFIDFNTLEQEKIDYIIKEYPVNKTFADVMDYYKYIGTIDTVILKKVDTEYDSSDIRKSTLIKFAKEYTKEKVKDELVKVCTKVESKDPILKFINAPTRLEFLVSIALVQHFKDIDVNPNYTVDDEGLPTFTASGGFADIVCYSEVYDSLVEVTLMCGRHDQTNNEIVPIRRHLIEYKEKNKHNTFSVFVAPTIHEDTKEMVDWYKHKDSIDIVAINISEFLSFAEANEVFYNIL